MWSISISAFLLDMSNEHANEKRPNDYQLDLQIEAARQHVKSFNFVLEMW